MRATLALLAIVLPVQLAAQAAPLRIAPPGSAIAEIPPAPLTGTAYYPASVLARLAIGLSADGEEARAVVGGDTIRFRAATPFFTRADQVYQLAFPVRSSNRELFLPEQLFIEWLPSRYPAIYEYREGVLRVRGPSLPAGDDGALSAQPAPPPAAPQRVVILDPGHGGRDPGKVGPNGLREKDATLMLASRVAAILRERGYEVHLTRTRDTLIALADRPRMANRWRANRPALFLSIHANSVRSTRVRGFETFFLSEARTEDERRVAEMENAAAQYEDEPESDGDVVHQILNDIRNDFYVRASSQLAEGVQDRIATFHSGPNRGVKRAGFRVLVGALMPAVLIEVAFISNAEEARLLRATSFQHKVATGVADAVDDFFSRHGQLWTAGSR